MGSAPSSSFCSPCKTDGQLTEAQHYCTTCKEYLCIKCKNLHGNTGETGFAMRPTASVMRPTIGVNPNRTSNFHHRQVNGGPLRVQRSNTAFLHTDEVRDCGDCKNDGRSREASQYCKYCKTDLCATCWDKHRRMPKDHKIQGSSKDHKIQGSSNDQGSRDSCDSNEHKIIDINNGLLNASVKSARNVNVRLPDDRRVPLITGCTFLGRGELVLCDHGNCKLILLNSDVTSELDFMRFYPYRPWDVSAVNKNIVAVTVPSNRTLRFIQIYPSLCTIDTVRFDKKCFGVAVAVTKIYVTCHQEDFTTGDVIELDINGNFIRRISCEENSFRSLFSWPYYVATNGDGSVLYVSDWKTNTIISLSPNGKILFQYKSNVLENLVGLGLDKVAGLYVDTKGNVIVCGSGSDKIQIISATDKKPKTLLKSADGLNKPHSVAYSNDTLVVGCEKNEVLLFKLQ